MSIGMLVDIGAAASGVGNVSAPDGRNPSKELGLNVAAQTSVAPALLSGDQTYLPQFADLASRMQASTAQSQANTIASLQPQLTATDTAAYNTAAHSTRAATVADLQEFSPGVAAAWRAANPGSATLLDQLNNSAQQGLDAGYNLTPQEQRQVQQNVRGAAAARGMGYGPADALQESQALTMQGEGLRNQRLAQAGSVASLNASVTPNSIATLTGMNVPQVTRAGALLPGAAQLNSGSAPSLFDPTNSYFQDLWSTNYNANAAANIATANNSAALWGGAAKQGGSGMGSMAGMLL